jgi:hypothetical protein
MTTIKTIIFVTRILLLEIIYNLEQRDSKIVPNIVYPKKKVHNIVLVTFV